MNRMGIIILIGLFSAVFTPLAATGDEPVGVGTGWRLSLEASLAQTQNAYSSNWDGEEKGSLNWAFNLNALAERQLNLLLNTRNTLKLSYGQLHNEASGGRSWEAPSTSTDLIDLESLLSFNFGFYVDPYLAARMQSRFVDNRYSHTEYINPITLTESCGIARWLIREKRREWIARVGVGIRQHIDRAALAGWVIDPSTADTLRPRLISETTSDAGFELVTEFNSILFNDISKVNTKLSIFQAVYYSKAEKLAGLPEENYWKDPDINWEVILTANVTRYIMVNVYTQLLYDKEISRGGRFKETISIGLTYSFSNE